MKLALLASAVLMAVAVAATPGHADESFVVSPRSVVALGAEGGDTFGLERISRNGVVVLLQPRGEDCTLRFPLTVGESLLLRAGKPSGDEDLVCEASLLSVTRGAKTEFSARCSMQPASVEKKCPPSAIEASRLDPGR